MPCVAARSEDLHAPRRAHAEVEVVDDQLAGLWHLDEVADAFGIVPAGARLAEDPLVELLEEERLVMAIVLESPSREEADVDEEPTQHARAGAVHSDDDDGRSAVGHGIS